MKINIIITGATGMVGEGVLLECLANSSVEQILIVNRRPVKLQHPKLKELIVPDFFKLDSVAEQLRGYDACFYCAGLSVVGLNEKSYTRITYDTTLSFANTLLRLNPTTSFCYVSGSHTDSSGKGRVMWARVKGKTENALSELGFRSVYNFRPGFMKPAPGQHNVKIFYKIIGKLYPVLNALIPKRVLTINEVGSAMINSILKGYPTNILEIKDIKALARVARIK